MISAHTFHVACIIYSVISATNWGLTCPLSYVNFTEYAYLQYTDCHFGFSELCKKCYFAIIKWRPCTLMNFIIVYF